MPLSPLRSNCLGLYDPVAIAFLLGDVAVALAVVGAKPAPARFDFGRDCCPARYCHKNRAGYIYYSYPADLCRSKANFFDRYRGDMARGKEAARVADETRRPKVERGSLAAPSYLTNSLTLSRHG